MGPDAWGGLETSRSVAEETVDDLIDKVDLMFLDGLSKMEAGRDSVLKGMAKRDGKKAGVAICSLTLSAASLRRHIASRRTRSWISVHQSKSRSCGVSCRLLIAHLMLGLRIQYRFIPSVSGRRHDTAPCCFWRRPGAMSTLGAG